MKKSAYLLVALICLNIASLNPQDWKQSLNTAKDRGLRGTYPS